MLKATPQRLGPWLVAAAAPHKPAELRDPAHGLVERGWTFRRRRTVMDGTIQRLPFLDLQQHATRHLGHRPRQHGGIKHPPGNDAIERQAALQALAGGQLPRFDATATFQNPMPHLNAPATGVPLDALDGVGDGMHRHRGQQQPLDGLHVRWRARLHGPARPKVPRSASPQTCDAGADTVSRDKTAAPAWLPAGLRATTGHLQEEVLDHRLRLNRGPHIALGRNPHSGPTTPASAARRPPDARPPAGHRHRLHGRQR